MSDSFLSRDELAALGLGAFGANVHISRNARIYNPARLFLGSHVRIDDFCVISAGAGIHIGDYVHIAAFCGLFGGGGIELGDFSTLSSKVSIYSVSDDYSGASLAGPTIPSRYRGFLKTEKVVMGKHTIVGVGSSVLPGVHLPEGVSVGAHSLMTKSAEPWSLYAGTPARKIRTKSMDALLLEAELRTEEKKRA